MTSIDIYSPAFCSCVYCKKQFTTKGIYTHFLRVHGTLEEKERMAKGNLTHNTDRHRTNINKANDRRKKYLEFPNSCKNCSSDLSYEHRWNKFCSKSCAATYNNINHSPERKFGPKKTKAYVPKILRVPKAIKTPKLKKKKVTFKESIIGEYSKLYQCTCNHCKLQFVSRKKYKYCIGHRTLYTSSRNIYQFTFNVYDYPNLFDLSLIIKNGWYSPGNRGPKNNNGVSRDHKISVHEAIKNGYDPYYITHPLNCELMLHSENKNKYVKSSMTYDQLVSLVDDFELAKGSGLDPHPH